MLRCNINKVKRIVAPEEALKLFNAITSEEEDNYPVPDHPKMPMSSFNNAD